MRITTNMIFDSLTEDILRAQEGLAKSYEAVASGKKVNRPSDDPVAISSILSYKDLISGLGQYGRNIEFAREYLANSETAMSGVTNMLSRLREIAVGQASGTATSATRLSASYEAQELYNQMIAVGNTRVGDRYLFSGYLYSTAPFDSSGGYSGDNNAAALNIGANSAFTYGMTGNRIFKGVGMSGGVDLYTIVQNFTTALQTNSLSGIQNAIGNLDSAITQIDNIRAEIGSRLNRLDSQKNNLEDFTVETRITLSGIEDADITELSTRLAMQQVTLEALQASAAKALQLNIFNFIR